MTGVFAAALEVQRFIQGHGWQFCIIGGIALARWGQPRATGDVDITLLTGFDNESMFIEALLKQFEARIEDAHQFALANRVLLLKASNRVGIDIALAGLPFEERMIHRSSWVDFGNGVRLMTAGAEDLIILKAFAGRPQDWIDIENVLIVQGDRLDWELVLQELKPLCELKESPESVQRLIDLRDRLTAD